MEWHGYVHLKFTNAGWVTSELKTFVEGDYGTTDSLQPNENTSFRPSADEKEIIMEIKAEESELARAAIVTMLADFFGVAEAAINTQLTYTIFAEGGTWDESRVLARTFITDPANNENWDFEI